MIYTKGSKLYCPDCGEVTYILLKDVTSGDKMKANQVIRGDGCHPCTGDMCICWSCCRLLSVRDMCQWCSYSKR